MIIALKVEINESWPCSGKPADAHKPFRWIGALPDVSLPPHVKLKKALQLVARELDPSRRYFPTGMFMAYEPSGNTLPGIASTGGRGRIAAGYYCYQWGYGSRQSLPARSSAKAGDTIAIESPTFFGLLMAIESPGMKALEIPTDPVTGVSLDKLEDAFKQKEGAGLSFCKQLQQPHGLLYPRQQQGTTGETVEKIPRCH